MGWLIGYLAGLATGIGIVLITIILFVKKIDRMHEELENLDEE